MNMSESLLFVCPHPECERAFDEEYKLDQHMDSTGHGASGSKSFTEHARAKKMLVNIGCVLCILWTWTDFTAVLITTLIFYYTIVFHQKRVPKSKKKAKKAAEEAAKKAAVEEAAKVSMWDLSRWSTTKTSSAKRGYYSDSDAKLIATYWKNKRYIDPHTYRIVLESGRVWYPLRRDSKKSQCARCSRSAKHRCHYCDRIFCDWHASSRGPRKYRCGWCRSRQDDGIE